jgi:hypothetical protein
VSDVAIKLSIVRLAQDRPLVRLGQPREHTHIARRADDVGDAPWRVARSARILAGLLDRRVELLDGCLMVLCCDPLAIALTAAASAWRSITT